MNRSGQPRRAFKEYMIVIKDWERGWEFFRGDVVCVYPDWTWDLGQAQRFPRKREAQRVLDRIKSHNISQGAVLWATDRSPITA